MFEWFNSLQAFATSAIAQNSLEALAALFLVAAFTEVGVPFPFIIDGALFITSFDSGIFSYHVPLVILALTLGREAGAAVIFWVSRFAGDAFIRWMGKRFPKLKLSERMAWLNARLVHRAPMAVAVARLTPGLLTVSSIAAGYSGMRYYQFVLGIILASVVADGILVIIGFAAKYGLSLFGFTPTTAEVVVTLVLVILLYWLFRWWWQRRRARRNMSLPG